MADEATAGATDAAERALLDEALKKGALIWLYVDHPASEGAGGRGQARWHAWIDGRIYLLTGEGEQPDPGLVPGRSVRVVVRSKDNKHLLAALEADVSRLAATDADWDAATAELAKERLNLVDAENAPRRWAGASYALFRLTPRLPLVRLPAEELSASHRAEPPPTSATTTRRKPWVLHRRGRHGPRLS